MARENIFEVFEKPAVEADKESENQLQNEACNEVAKASGLFTLKDVPASDRKPTTIIFSKRNYIRLKTLAVNANLTMSEYVNRWLEGMEAEG